MADQSNILREYLIALGFKVDEVQGKRFDNSINRWDKSAMKLGKSIVGVGVAAQAMVTDFAFRMERMYYSSRLAESTASNLQALNFGGKNIGIANMAGQVERFAATLRSNPGLIGLLNSLGVKVEGRDKADVMLDLVEATKKMPFYIGQRYASMFGINPDDLLLMQEGLATMREAATERKRMANELGVDTDKAAVAAREYMNAWREIGMMVGLARDAITIEMLPAMRSLAGVTKQVLIDWIRIVQTPREKLVEDLRLGLGIDTPDKVVLSPEAKRAQEGKPKLGPVEQKIEDELPYKAPEGNIGWGRWLENMLRERAYKDARKKGLLPPDPKAVPPGMMSPEEAGLGKEEPSTYKAPKGNIGWAKSYEEFMRWRENRGRAQRGEPPLPEPSTETAPPPTAAPAVPAKPPGAPAKSAAGKLSPYAVAQENLAVLRTALEKARQSGTAADVAAIEVEIKRQQEVPAPPQDPASTPERQSLMQQLEIKYALPTGMLDRVWKQESGRGRKMLSPKGAEGHFGFMPKTQKEFGLKNPQDFNESASKAAEKIAGLIKRYGGNVQLAAAGYNWGEGNLEKAMAAALEKNPGMSQQELTKYVLGVAPKETRDYVNGVAGQGGGTTVEVHQENKYYITEAGDAKKVAQEIVDTQKSQYADTVRQFTGRIH